jgi:hypothetical protein
MRTASTADNIFMDLFIQTSIFNLFYPIIILSFSKSVKGILKKISRARQSFMIAGRRSADTYHHASSDASHLKAVCVFSENSKKTPAEASVL